MTTARRQPTLLGAKRLLKTRFGGVLTSGCHSPDGKACVRELAAVLRGLEWSDHPDGDTASPTDKACQVLNDASWSSDAARTAACLPLALLSEATAPTGWLLRYAELNIRRVAPHALRSAAFALRNAARVHPEEAHQVAMEAAAASVEEAATQCEEQGTRAAAYRAVAAAYSAGAAAYHAGDAAYHARAAAYSAGDAAYSAGDAADSAVAAADRAVAAAYHARAAADRAVAAAYHARAAAYSAGDEALRLGVAILLEAHGRGPDGKPLASEASR